jgi:hypothetical protein
MDLRIMRSPSESRNRGAGEIGAGPGPGEGPPPGGVPPVGEPPGVPEPGYGRLFPMTGWPFQF